jgi:hypothetical protein
MAKAADDHTEDRPPFPPRVPTPQERADELLQRWRLARAANIPPHRRLEERP